MSECRSFEEKSRTLQQLIMNKLWQVKKRNFKGKKKLTTIMNYSCSTGRLRVAYLGVTRVSSSVGWRIRQVVKV